MINLQYDYWLKQKQFMVSSWDITIDNYGAFYSFHWHLFCKKKIICNMFNFRDIFQMNILINN